MRRFTLALALVLMLPAFASAQVSTRNKMQFGLGGFGYVMDGFTSLNAQLSLTKFFTSALEVGGSFSGTLSSSDGGEDVNGFVFGQAKYNFVSQSLTVPYITIGAGTALTTENPSLSFQYGGGLKRFLNESVSVNAEAVALGQANEVGFEPASMILLNVGFSVYIARK